MLAQDSPSLRARFLGVAGWEVTDGKTVLLIDPYISRPSGPPGDGTPPRPGRSGALGPQNLAIPDTLAVDKYLTRADYILLTHAYYVHLLDVPHIARTRQAVVIGSESVANIVRACGVSEDKIITIRGGEDFDFGSFSVRVIPSLHSATLEKRYYNSRVGHPPLVIATHWDDSMLPYGAPLVAQLADAETFRREVQSASPRSRVLIPRHLEPISLDAPRPP